jgi:hypothetical protein
LPSYLVLKLVLIWTVLARSSALICMTLASSTALNEPGVEGMVRLVKEGGALRHNSFSSAAATRLADNSMLLYS